MWPLPIHFTAALCGNQAWIIKVSSEQWSIHWGPRSQTPRPYFSRNDIEITWVCFQTMHINVKYVRPNMSIIITVQAEAMSRLIPQKRCWVMLARGGFSSVSLQRLSSDTVGKVDGLEQDQSERWAIVVPHQPLYSEVLSLGSCKKCSSRSEGPTEGTGQKMLRLKVKLSLLMCKNWEDGSKCRGGRH